MKSDSGGEMESCRSSDSELERELHEKEKEIRLVFGHGFQKKSEIKWIIFIIFQGKRQRIG